MAASWANAESVYKSAPTQKGCPEAIEACVWGGGECFVCLGNQAILICSKGVSGFPELPADTLLWMPVIYAVP